MRRARSPSALHKADAGQPTALGGDQPRSPVHLDQRHVHLGGSTRGNPQQKPGDRCPTDDGTQRSADASTAVGQDHSVLAQHGLQPVEVAAGRGRQKAPGQVRVSLPADREPPPLLGQVARARL